MTFSYPMGSFLLISSVAVIDDCTKKLSSDFTNVIGQNFNAYFVDGISPLLRQNLMNGRPRWTSRVAITCWSNWQNGVQWNCRFHRAVEVNGWAAVQRRMRNLRLRQVHSSAVTLSVLSHYGRMATTEWQTTTYCCTQVLHNKVVLSCRDVQWWLIASQSVTVSWQ